MSLPLFAIGNSTSKPHTIMELIEDKELSLPSPLTAPRRWRTQHPTKRTTSAFSLTELLVVLVIISLLIGLSVPAISSMGKAKTVTAAAFRTKDFIDYARNYAISRHTLVRVGVEEITLSSGKTGIVLYPMFLEGAQTEADNPADTTAWRPLGSPMLFEGMRISNDSGSFLPTGSEFIALDEDTSELTNFSRQVGALSNNVNFQTSFLISRNGEICLKPNSRAPDVFYPSRNIYFGLQPENGSGDDWAVIAMNGTSGRVHIYRPEDQ